MSNSREWHIYKAIDYDGKCIGMVMALDRSLADAYWIGQGTVPYSVKEVVAPPDNHPYGVVPILIGVKVKNRNMEDIIILNNP